MASWKQLQDGNRLVQLDFVRAFQAIEIRDLRQRLVALLSAKYGRGSAAIRKDDLFQKRWDGEHVRIQLTCVEDANLPTACIEYFRPLGSEFDKI
ncbi:hypothetical protein FHS61_003206 [Altererythrobacter atlanticus]|uniref:hypothetical protein n=1 Tax=Croceibacterium atlanticum TaxID=1267766 RepID=UPI0012E19D1F|nr:hypothetical protein [Croceibacterium atlanticum]MBB5734156.1 hypothetical protein [Croceibacterium atlanticum]